MEVCVKRQFFGWDTPLLPAVVDELAQRYEKENNIWLENVVCVLPGKRAIRRLEELLTLKARDTGRGLVLPKSISQGTLPELLIEREDLVSEYASSEELALIWQEILGENENFDPSELDELWQTLGRAGLTFTSATRELQKSLPAIILERWEELAQLEDVFRDKLTKYETVEKTVFRLEALKEDFPENSREIYLIGAVDLGALGEEFLKKTFSPITACIGAPEEEGEGFTEFGTVKGEYWSERLVGERGAPPKFLVAEDNFSEASSLLRELKHDSPPSLQDVAIGLADEETSPYLTLTLDAHEVPYHLSVSTHPLMVELAAFFDQLGKLLVEGTYQDVVQLLSLPRSSEILRLKNGDVSLSALHGVSLRSCPFVIYPESGKVLPALSSELKALITEVSEFIAPFQSKKTYGEWETLLEELFDLDSEVGDALYTLLGEFRERYGTISSELRRAFSGEEIAFALSSIASQQLGSLSEEKQENGIEIIGWLELLLDDSPYVYLTGAHDRALPGGKSEHRWLPEKIRSALRLGDDQSRIAREHFIMENLKHSRERFTCFFAKRDGKGDFHRPSRLLFGGEREQFIETVRETLVSKVERVPVELFGRDFGNGKPWEYSGEEISYPSVSEISVTGFRDYVTCPFRFYLKHVKKLSREDPIPQELGALYYGNFVHDLLEDFSKSEVGGSDNPEEIEEFLLTRLKAVSFREFGTVAKPAVDIQLFYLRNRLKAFAHQQAEWRRSGWEIRHAEFAFPKGEVRLTHGAGSTTIKGRIDRIDYHPERDTWIAIDYKTANISYAPDSSHYSESSEEWHDFQLPLYREALRQLGFQGEIKTAYVNLPASAEETSFLETPWDDQHYTAGLAVATEIAERVHRGEFWPPTEEVLRYDDFSDLLGMGQYRELVDDDLS